MDHRRVLLPLNLDFNPLSPCSSCSVSRNDVCCHSAPAIFPITNPEASTSASTLSMSSRDPNDSSDDGNDESGDNVVQIKQQSSNKSFTRATNEDKLPHDGQLKNLIKVGSRKLELHPPLDPKNKIGTSAELQSSINDLGTSPKFVLKRKSVKIVDQDSHNTTGNQSDATYVIRDKSHTTAKSQMSAISSCLSLSKVDINGNSMNCADNKTKTVPKQKKNSQRKKEEQIPPSNYIPPPLDLLERFHFLSSGNEARSSVSQNEDFQNISKEGDEGDPDSFQPPKLPKHIQEKLLETIQSMKKTSSPSQRKDHGQGEETGVQKNDDVEYDLDSKIHHISFHYETKNGCLEGLTATGFSVNPTDPDGQSYLPNPVSTYFPGKPASQRNMVNFGVTQIPSFMKHNFYRNGEGGEMKNDQLYQLVMDKAHKSRRTLSNLSMMPMMYSENGSHPRIHELERGMSARSENVTTLKICGNPEPNPMSSLRKPKMPNSTEVLEALELVHAQIITKNKLVNHLCDLFYFCTLQNNNYKLDIPLESKTSGFRFSTYYRDLSKRLKFSKAFQPYDKEKAILSHKNQTGVKKFSRPITRRASNLASPTPPTITNLANVPNQKPTDTKITKTTVSTVRKVNSTGSIPKSVSSHNLKVRSRSSHAFNLSTENQNSNGGNSPEIKTAPNLTHPLQTGSITIPGQNTALRALLHKKRTKVPSLKIPAKKKPPMPPTIKNAVRILRQILIIP